MDTNEEDRIMKLRKELTRDALRDISRNATFARGITPKEVNCLWAKNGSYVQITWSFGSIEIRAEKTFAPLTD